MDNIDKVIKLLEDNIDNECSYLMDKKLFDKLGVLASMQEECIQQAYVLGLKHALLLIKGCLNG